MAGNGSKRAITILRRQPGVKQECFVPELDLIGCVADLFDFHMIYLLKCLLKATCSLVRFVVFIIQGEALAGKEQKSMQSATI